jgi:hypothetical protein
LNKSWYSHYQREHSDYGGTGAPSGKGYTKIYSAEYAFAALKADGSITAWGYSDDGGTGAPSGKGYTKIYSARHAFAALKADGSITACLCLQNLNDPTP